MEENKEIINGFHCDGCFKKYMIDAGFTALDESDNKKSCLPVSARKVREDMKSYTDFDNKDVKARLEILEKDILDGTMWYQVNVYDAATYIRYYVRPAIFDGKKYWLVQMDRSPSGLNQVPLLDEYSVYLTDYKNIPNLAKVLVQQVKLNMSSSTTFGLIIWLLYDGKGTFDTPMMIPRHINVEFYRESCFS